jgi:hypothetical protein
VAAEYQVGISLTAHDQTGPGTRSAQDRLREVAAKGRIPIRVEDHFSEPLNRLKGSLGEVAKMAAGVAIGGLVSSLTQGLGGALTDATGKAKELYSNTKSLMMVTGGTAEATSTLVSAFERYGVGADKASMSLGMFAKRLQGMPLTEEEIAQGMDDNGKAFKGFGKIMDELGIATVDAAGKTRPMQEVILDMADSFKKLGPGPEATALAMGAFGRAGKQMLPLLMQGKEGIEEAMATAAKFGLQLTTENMGQIKEFSMANKDLGEALDGLKVQLGVAVMPVFAALAKIGAQLAATFNTTLMPAIKQLGESLKGVVAFVRPLLPMLGGIVLAIVGVAAATKAWGIVQAILNVALTANPIGLLIVAIAALAGAAIYAYNTFAPFKDVVNALFEAFTGDAGALGIVYDVIRQVFGDSAAEFLQPFLQWFMDAIPAVKSFIGDVGGILSNFGLVFQKVFRGDVSGALDSFMAIMGALGAKFGPIVQAFIGWVAPMIPKLLGALVQLQLRLWGWLASQVAPLVRQLGQWARAFLDWIGPMIPPFLRELGALALQLWAWISENVPPLVAQLLQWGAAFVGWIAPQIPPLLGQLAGLAGSLIGWIGDQLPGIAAQLLQWGVAFVEWVGPKIADLLVALAGLAGTMVGWIIARTPELVSTLLKWAEAFVGWIATAITNLPANLGNMVQAIKDWITGTGSSGLSDAGQSFGKSFLDAIWNFLTAGVPKMIGDLKNLIGNMAGSFSVSVAAQQTPATVLGTATGAPTVSISPDNTPGHPMQHGGFLREPITGIGPSGARYQLHANEFVSPAGHHAQAAAAALNGGFQVPPAGTAGNARSGASVSLHVTGTQITVHGGDSGADWSQAADGLWEDLYGRLSRAMENRTLGVGRSAI